VYYYKCANMLRLQTASNSRMEVPFRAIAKVPDCHNEGTS
jgi:hypothetical protein